MIMNSEKNVIQENKKIDNELENNTLNFKNLNDQQSNTQSLLDVLTTIVGELQNKCMENRKDVEKILDMNTQNVKKIENIENLIKEQHNYTITLNKINAEQEINTNIVKGLIDKFEKNISDHEVKNNQIIQINKNINKMEENISILTPNILYPGIIVAFNGTLIPSGWHICDGTNNTPDLRGRFILSSGVGKELSIRNINDIGGSETHTLSIDEIPGHIHSGTTSSNGSHIHTTNANGINMGMNIKDSNKGILSNLNGNTEENNINLSDTITLNSSGLHTHTFTTNITGGNNNHNNMPPFYVLAYIMRL